MKFIAIFLVLGLFSTSAMAKDTQTLGQTFEKDLNNWVWTEYKIKHAQTEINYNHVQINELHNLQGVFSKRQYQQQLKAFRNNMKKTLTNLNASERAQLIKNYEAKNPKIASTLKNL